MSRRLRCGVRLQPEVEWLHGLARDLPCQHFHLLVDQLARVLADDLAAFDRVHDHLWEHVAPCRKLGCTRCRRPLTDPEVKAINSRLRNQPGTAWPPLMSPRA